jgi:hypothetical protein
MNEISITHEVYVVPKSKGGFENIYVNTEVYDFGERPLPFLEDQCA